MSLECPLCHSYVDQIEPCKECHKRMCLGCAPFHREVCLPKHKGLFLPEDYEQQFNDLEKSIGDREGLLNTTVETKQQYFKQFSDMIEDQFKHGGDKYKLQGFEGMEATDLISKLWETSGEDEQIGRASCRERV